MPIYKKSGTTTDTYVFELRHSNKITKAEIEFIEKMLETTFSTYEIFFYLEFSLNKIELTVSAPIKSSINNRNLLLEMVKSIIHNTIITYIDNN